MIKKTLMIISLVALCCAQGSAQDKIPHLNAHTISVLELSPQMKEVFVQHIAKHQYSANLYMTFAGYCARLGLEGCKEYFMDTSEDKTGYASFFCSLLIEGQEEFHLEQINAITVMPISILDAFTKLAENESELTRSFHNLSAQAIEENFFEQDIFLRSAFSYLREVQDGKEKEVRDLLQLLSSAPDDSDFIRAFDEKLREWGYDDEDEE